MAKARSPQYPAIGLKEAVARVAEVYQHDYQNMIPREVVAKHMGYSGLSGKSLGVLAALGKYGLLEGRGDSTKVSDLAVTIIAHPERSPERVEALQKAAALPELFAELDGRFPGGRGSDQALRSYLLTQKFIPSAADAAIRAYRETKSFVENESGGYTGVEVINLRRDSSEPLRMPPARYPSAPPEDVPIQGRDGDPYRLSVTKSGGIEVVARLRTPADVEDLTRALEAWKVLLNAAGMAPKKTESEQ